MQLTPFPIIEYTADNSHTLRDRLSGQTYHSLNGACAESEHVFIRSGLLYLHALGVTSFDIFEVGLGTGLNVLLALHTALKYPGITIRYSAVENNPLPQEIFTALNYPKILHQEGLEEEFLHIHTAPWGKATGLSNRFVLTKYKQDAMQFGTEKKFNLVFHDAFSPGVQPGLWSYAFFNKIAEMMWTGGVLVTYSAAGQVRRNLKEAGFDVEKIPGPPGKREMTRAIKK